jgi:PAS domain-containing protein
MKILSIRDDKVVGLQGVAHDVTKRKKTEEELQEERDFNQTLIQASPAFLWRSERMARRS